jgi:hypothetical protein
MLFLTPALKAQALVATIAMKRAAEVRIAGVEGQTHFRDPRTA